MGAAKAQKKMGMRLTDHAGAGDSPDPQQRKLEATG